MRAPRVPEPGSSAAAIGEDRSTMGELHQITVMGREFRIRSESDAEHLREVARYVDERISEVAEGQRHVAIQNVLLLTALNMADELFRLRAEQETMTANIRHQSRALLERLGKRCA